MASKIDQCVKRPGNILATRDNHQSEPIQVQQKSQKKLIKNRDNKRVSHKKKPDPKSQVKLNAGDEKLIADYIQQQEQIAISSSTEALTTTKNVLKAIGKNPEDKALQGEVSKTLKSLGWKKLGKKTYQGKQQRVLHQVLLITRIKIYRHCSTINFTEDYFRQQYTDQE